MPVLPCPTTYLSVPKESKGIRYVSLWPEACTLIDAQWWGANAATAIQTKTLSLLACPLQALAPKQLAISSKSEH